MSVKNISIKDTPKISFFSLCFNQIYSNQFIYLQWFSMEHISDDLLTWWSHQKFQWNQN